MRQYFQLGSNSSGNNNDERTPLPTLTLSAEHFGRLRGFRIPITAVVTAKEKQKFTDEWSKYVFSGSEREVRNQSINFMDSAMDWAIDWAMDWNREVDEMESGDGPLSAINRKHANHLESYFKKYFAKSNATTTLHPIRHKDEKLRKELRENDLNKYWSRYYWRSIRSCSTTSTASFAASDNCYTTFTAHRCSYNK
jgi:hypothetical protein